LTVHHVHFPQLLLEKCTVYVSGKIDYTNFFNMQKSTFVVVNSK
jgi:hypothetical protein